MRLLIRAVLAATNLHFSQHAQDSMRAAYFSIKQYKQLPLPGVFSDKLFSNCHVVGLAITVNYIIISA